jgi:response regulator of citrate/malate metabolism
MPTVRSRDVRANIKDYGFERGMQITFEQFLEEFAEYRQHMRELVEMQQMVIDNLNTLHRFSEALKNKMEQMTRDREQDDASD